MLRMNRVQVVSLGALIGGLACIVAGQLATPTLAQTEAPQQNASGPSLQPIEEDIHEYMEYVHQPTYRSLKKAMNVKPAGDDGWLAIKSGALILSESGNLLMLRGPEDNRDEWLTHAADVRDTGAQMYRAAHDKKFDQVERHYRQMINQCNSCHQQFAGGEHQLEP